jgi:glycosyltransferase involved in cell wall biosynthesis
VHIQSRDLVYRRLLPRQRNRIITVSDFIRDALIRYGIPASRLHTIHNGTDFCADEIESEAEGCAASKAEGELPVRAELSLPPDAELIGLFGRVNEFKGHFLLAEAAGAVVAARPRAYFVCVGAVAPAIQRRLWEIASAGGMAERLRFTGVRNDVKRLMSAMDVVTLPSRYEACSMSIIEAMAMGKPVVATRAGGNPELVEDQETGLLIERNPSALAEGLVAVLSDAARRTRMGEAALLRARTHFTASVMTSHIERLYQEILERPPVA